MRLEAERMPPIEEPSEEQVRSTIAALRSYGPSSFASLTDEAGSYLQVAGGTVTCMLERRDARTGRHYRAHHDDRSPVFPDGTKLTFGGGEVSLAADEWFDTHVVTDTFLAFLKGESFPDSVKWREVRLELKD